MPALYNQNASSVQKDTGNKVSAQVSLFFCNDQKKRRGDDTKWILNEYDVE